MKLPTGDELRDRANKLGVDLKHEIGLPPQTFPAPENVLQRRVIEAERHLREQRLWVIAVISSVASIISALAAWTAVLVGR